MPSPLRSWPRRSSTRRCTTACSSRSTPRAVLGTLLLVARPPLAAAARARRLGAAAGDRARGAAGAALPRGAGGQGRPRRGRHPGLQRRAVGLLPRAPAECDLWRPAAAPIAIPSARCFPGTLPLVLSAVALVPPVGAIRLAYAAGLVAAFDMSLGFNGVTYKHLYRWLLPDPRPSRPRAHEHRPGHQPGRAGGVRRAAAAGSGSGAPAREPPCSPRSCSRAARRRLAGARAAPRLVAAAADLRRASPDSRSSWRSFRPSLNIPLRHQRRALHVLFDLALAADDQRLQRLYAAETTSR